MEKKTTYVFSKEIDDNINTLAISISFILIGILLYFDILNFNSEIISNIVQWFFIITGFLMISSGFTNKKDNKYKIKGFDSLGIGIFFLIIWYLLNGFDFFITVIIVFLILVIGVYGTIKGILEILYSLKLKKEKISKLITEVVLFLTNLFVLILTFLNILQALNII